MDEMKDHEGYHGLSACRVVRTLPEEEKVDHLNPSLTDWEKSGIFRSG